jgi:hypothetical protein
MKTLRIVFQAAVILAACRAASAQTASVSGSVVNARGGVVANADVTLRVLAPPGTAAPPRMPAMPGMADERTTQTKADGTFTFENVPRGNYVLQVDFSGLERFSQEIALSGQPATIAVTLQPLDIPGAESAATAAAPGDVQTLLERIRALEQRISDLESAAVLSEPETRVRRVEVYVDQNGNEHDEPVDGTRKQTTYRRERVYRRQTINEKLEEAFADQDSKKIAVGVSAASVTQFARQTSGARTDADRHAYQLSSADLFFSAGLAQYTSFFADLVGLSGAPPDAEIHGLTLLNSYTARLVRQNEVNVREAWLRTELFSQKLALSAGRLDLTNYFDRNAVANDETTQFISDALVNNPALALSTNGTGLVGVFDTKNGVALKAGLQQSNNDATNLSESIYSLAEVDYVARPRGLSEGNYRLWYRADNSVDRARHAIGLSVDQKLTPVFTVFGRYGTGKVDAPTGEGATRSSSGHHFISGGFQVQNGLVFNRLDAWGVGYAQTQFPSGPSEKLAEGYYSFQISEKLRLSLHLQHVFETAADESSVGFLVPAVRLQARF